MDVLSQWVLHLQGVVPGSDGGVSDTWWRMGSVEMQGLATLVRELTEGSRAGDFSRGDMVRESFWGGVRNELSLYLAA